MTFLASFYTSLDKAGLEMAQKYYLGRVLPGCTGRADNKLGPMETLDQSK
jgi:hypothetical protein